MKTVRVTAIRDHLYANVQRVTGDVYQVRAEDIEALTAAGSVRVRTPRAAKGKYSRRDMRADK